ncbi:MAG TPA: hypothetical protein VFJ94_10775 [Intrasporangium sp.]|uniref:hypothetical protein n=1 Tax=Intrasporangium sp. TaxID=1925024 RepID=UPI002D78D359|nr:hypothetical protein [Intrasporangium sp.]HET7398994.1 hypothetical protein [Intrasporangium sp.]
MPDFVDAVAKSTGEKQVIPAHWLDDPVLGADFEPYDERADMPARNASKADWAAYASSQGLPPEQVESLSRDELATIYVPQED